MSPQNNLTEWKITEEFNNQRIDYWLKKKISFIPYPTLCKFIRKGIVRVNGKRIKNSSILNTGDIIKFSRFITNNDDHSKNIIHYNNKFFEFIRSLVLFKDKHLIVLNKPSGLAVQGGSKIKLNVDLLLDSLKYDLEFKPRLVHRIDKETSGILLIARTLNSSKFFGELFKKRLINKKYLALVNGIPKSNFGKIIAPININNKEQDSLTYFKRIDSKNGISLLLLKPITGRKHQIRYHLNFIGNPIIGDKKFRNFDRFRNKQLHLHAYSLNFKNYEGEKKQFTAPLPDYFKLSMEKLNLKKISEQDLNFSNLKKFKLID